MSGRVLLSDRFPLRRSTALTEYRNDVWLPWAYGRVTVPGVEINSAGTDFLLADHAIVGVLSVKVDGAETNAWELDQRIDDTGKVQAVLRLGTKPERLAVTIAGKPDPYTGALLEHPADIAADILAECGWTVPAMAFDALRADLDDVEIAGLINTAQSLRAVITGIMHSVDADWSAAPLKAWTWTSAEPIATIDHRNCPNAEAVSQHDDVFNTLNLTYGTDYAQNAPTGALTLRALDVLADQGEIVSTLNLPWIRRTRDALRIGSQVLQRRARAQWAYSLPLPRTLSIAPGDVLDIQHPWLPALPAFAVGADIDEDGQRIDAIAWTGHVPTIEVVGRGALVDADASEQISITYVDGVATFTILDELGAPLAGAQVTLETVATRVTDQNGRAQFATPRGVYTLLISASGFEDQEMEVEI